MCTAIEKQLWEGWDAWHALTCISSMASRLTAAGCHPRLTANESCSGTRTQMHHRTDAAEKQTGAYVPGRNFVMQLPH